MIQIIPTEFENLIALAYQVSSDVGQSVEEILRDGNDRPFTLDESERLLAHIFMVLRRTADQRHEPPEAHGLGGRLQDLIDQVLSAQKRVADAKPKRLPLVERNGIGVTPIFPRPCFHGREIAVNGGFVKTTDVALWDENERLDIHLGQFEKKSGRRPTPDELLAIMQSKMSLPGIPDDQKADQFEISVLARSIAVNGVRKPPIIDLDGTLLDGNRRIAACHYILGSNDFDSEQKRRVEYVYVWQLTEHATDDERNAVVVSLNFEPDCKQDWPDYVKARKVYEEWQAMMAAEPRSPGPQRQASMKKQLSIKFALGPDTAVVNRYLKMVDWAGEFELYHVGEKSRDTYEVKHKANRYFQYFDEIAKGTRPGGVAHALEQDESFKHTVFDLLFDGKFRNWRDIRELKHIYEVPEAREALRRARSEPDVDAAQEHIDNAQSIARTQKAEAREMGANTRIEVFVKWLEELPVRAFRDTIRPDNLNRLLRGLRLVEKHLETLPDEMIGG